MKWLNRIKAVAKYIGGCFVMLGIVMAVIACGSEDFEVIKNLLLLAGVVAGFSLPCFMISLAIDEIIDRME